jgi:hypothetical protein
MMHEKTNKELVERCRREACKMRARHAVVKILIKFYATKYNTDNALDMTWNIQNAFEIKSVLKNIEKYKDFNESAQT